jgi:hypothetical protein
VSATFFPASSAVSARGWLFQGQEKSYLSYPPCLRVSVLILSGVLRFLRQHTGDQRSDGPFLPDLFFADEIGTYVRSTPQNSQVLTCPVGQRIAAEVSRD